MSEAMLLQAALILPLAAAVFALLVADGAGGRSVPIALVAVAAACAGASGALASLGREVTWQGFETDAWRGMLAAGALAGTAAAMQGRSAAVLGALGTGGGLAAASLLSPNLHALGLLLVASSFAFALSAFARDDASPLRRARVLAVLALSDVLAVAALATAAGTTLAFERLGDVPGALLLVAAIVRLGLVPAVIDDALRAGAGLVWLVPLRAQGALLASLAVAGSTTRGYALVAAGSLAALMASIRLLRDANPAALMVVPAAIVACGLGIGGFVAITGAAVTLAVSFATALLLLASGKPELASPLASFAPAGGALLGFGLVGGALWRLAAARPEFLPAAIALGAAAGLAAVATWPAAERLGASPRHVDAPRTARAGGLALVAVPAIALAGVTAFAPAFTVRSPGAAIGLAAGAAPALAAVPESPAEGLGIAVAGLALAGLLAGGVTRGTRPTHREPAPPRWMHGWAAALPAPREHSIGATERAVALARPWIAFAAFAAAAAIAFTIRLILVAGGRGWL